MINDPISALPCIFSMHSCGPHSDQVCPSKLFEVPANRLQTPFKKKKKKRQLLNFVSCRVRENFNDFSKSCLWQILNYLSALVNSADVKYGVIPFFAWKIPSKFLLVLRHQRRGYSLTYIIHLFNGRSAAVMITIQSLQRAADSQGIET